MSPVTADQLRAALREGAEVQHDAHLHERAAAVHHRVRVVRRRRAATVAGVVAAAVVAVPLARLVTPPQVDPAGRDLAGRTAPADLVANGFTYDFERGVEGSADEPLRLRLPASDEPRLVSWTVSGTDAEARLTDRAVDDDTATWTGGGSGFETYEYVDPGIPADLVLRRTAGSGEGRLAMAVYTLSDESPAGLSGHGTTFRDQVGGDTRIGGAVGDTGQSSVSFDVTVPDGELGFSTVCAAPRQYWYHLSVAGQTGWSGSSCDPEDVRADAGGVGLSLDLRDPGREGDVPVRTGDTVRVTISLHRGSGDDAPEVSVPGAWVGAAAYRLGPARPVGWGLAMDETLEAAGHTWRLDRLDRSAAGAAGQQVTVRADGPTWVQYGVAADQRGTTRWSTRLDGRRQPGGFVGPRGSWGPQESRLVGAGESFAIDQRLTRGDGNHRFYVATYSLADNG